LGRGVALRDDGGRAGRVREGVDAAEPGEREASYLREVGRELIENGTGIKIGERPMPPRMTVLSPCGLQAKPARGLRGATSQRRRQKRYCVGRCGQLLRIPGPRRRDGFCARPDGTGTGILRTEGYRAPGHFHRRMLGWTGRALARPAVMVRASNQCVIRSLHRF
jgi:hypothetical protein